MSEAAFRRTLIKNLKEIHAVPVENISQPGTPDINYCEGWLELKILRNWPVRVDTKIKLHHFTIKQKSWFKKRSMAGGKVFLFMKIKKEWLLFDFPAIDNIQNSTRANLYKLCLRRWIGKLDYRELIKCLML